MPSIKQLTIKYPPDFDGELHIFCRRTDSVVGKEEVNFNFTITEDKNKTNEEVLCKVARDILRQFNK